MLCLLFICSGFFFFKQKTAYEMRISDWSSDVCSSDLDAPLGITRQSEQHQWRAVGAGIVIALHCQHLGRPVLERVEPLRVASEDLDRRNKCGHPHRDRKSVV